jgi:dihydrofolate synthase/folylpolyglutamate synthase
MGQVESVKKVIEKKCVLQESKLEYSNRECFFELNLNGEFQKENCALALKVSKFLSKRDRFEFNNVKIEQVLKTIKFPGRFEIKKIQNKTVIFDGAHNPQKMETFLISLRKKYPQKKFHFLIAFKKKKDYAKLLKQIVGTAENITITSIKSRQQDLGVERENLDKITKKLDEMDYTNYNVINGSREAFEKGLKIEKEKILVVTGSLYLISEIYKEIDL